MTFQNCRVRQGPVHINDRNSGDVTREHRERPAVPRPDDLATPPAIAHVKQLPNQTPIRALESDVELRTVKNRDFLTDRDHLAVR